LQTVPDLVESLRQGENAVAHINLHSLRTKRPLQQSISFFSFVVVMALVCFSATAVTGQEPATALGASASASPKTAEDELAELRRKVQELDSEVSRLKMLVAKLDRYRQIDYIRDLLMKEEQRAELLQSQMLEISVKETPLQTRLDEIEDLLRPQRLEQQMAGVGSTRPEEDRDAVRTRLANEKRRIQTQLDLSRQSRLRLQASLTTADASIARLRQRLTEAARPQ